MSVQEWPGVVVSERALCLFGFGFPVFVTRFVAFWCLLRSAWQLKFDVKSYLLTSPLAFYFFGMFKHLMTFVLFWALAYTVTHVY